MEGATSFALRALGMRLIKFKSRCVATFCVLQELNFSPNSQLVKWLRTMRNICCRFPTGFLLDSHTSDVVTVDKEVLKRPIRRTVRQCQLPSLTKGKKLANNTFNLTVLLVSLKSMNGCDLLFFQEYKVFS